MDEIKEAFEAGYEAAISDKSAADEESEMFLAQLKEDIEEQGYSVQTFDEAGLMTNNLGLVIDGNQFEWLGSW